MIAVAPSSGRVLSGMRASGRLHLGHFHGVLVNWIKLQYEFECFFFVADWHGLTTNYENPQSIADSVWEMVIDWLAAGVNPGAAHLFLQSRVPETAELHLLLSMITPIGWLERVPTYKDQQQKLKDKDLSTYGFLGYPLLQSADVLLYKGNYVPVGEDQVAHIELVREVARRFNYLYGRDEGFIDKAELAIKKLSKATIKLYNQLRRAYQEQGDKEALESGKALIEAQLNLSMGDRERLIGYLEGIGKIILPEPEPLLTKESRMPGIDGQKMSKSYNNAIYLREAPESVQAKIKTMPTDPARVRRSDPGEPEKCPVWNLHKVYSNDEVKQWVQVGCRTAGIGCLDCKKPLIDSIIKEQQPILERAREFENNPKLVRGIIAEGCEFARDEAKRTLAEVKEAIGLDY